MEMHKEVVWILNNKYYFLLFVVLFGCVSKKVTKSEDNNHVYQFIPKQITYDTISGIFFYENLIKSYIEDDAIVKGSGFILTDTVSEAAYKNGYYINGVPYATFLLQKGIKINVDKESIAIFYDSLFQKSFREGTTMETKINPFCGTFYKKFQMKIEVIFIDSIYQRVPLFVDCNQYKDLESKNYKKGYQMMLLPTYAISKIIAWREL